MTKNKIKTLRQKTRFKNNLLAFCSAIVLVTATILNSFQNHNYCGATNNKLYDALKTVLNHNILVKLNNGNVANVDWEEYLIGVLAGEMGPISEKQALAAQALAAKNYACFHLVSNILNNKPQHPIASTNSFQVYIDKPSREKIYGKNLEKYENLYKEAINQTKNLIITYFDKTKPFNNNKNVYEKKELLVNSVYFAEAGERTEDAKNVWGSDVPYLKSVDNSFEKSPIHKIELGFDETFNLFKAKKNEAIKPQKLTESFIIKRRDNSNHVEKITAFGVEMNGKETRQILKLKSTNFTVDYNEKENKIIFNCKGFGHSVGMSQAGAKKLAQQKKTFEEIIKHYYSDVEVKNIEELI